MRHELGMRDEDMGASVKGVVFEEEVFDIRLIPLYSFIDIRLA
jgi:hypothetical protein